MNNFSAIFSIFYLFGATEEYEKIIYIWCKWSQEAYFISLRESIEKQKNCEIIKFWTKDIKKCTKQYINVLNDWILVTK